MSVATVGWPRSLVILMDRFGGTRMTQDLPDDARRAAAEWFVLLNGGDATGEDRARHRAWLSARSEHRDAYDSVCETFTLATEAHMAAAMPNLGFTARQSHDAPRDTGWRGWALAAAGALVAVVIGVRAGPGLVGTHYSTAVGEHRAITLADGSIVHMNADTELIARFTDGARDIDLRRGEAMFEVAKDHLHPFRVHAGDRTIQAVGTAFDVDRRGTAVDVAVSEGVVVVSAPGVAAPEPATRPSDSAVNLSRGYAVTYIANQPLGPTRTVTSDQVGSWQHGILYYEDVPFARLVDDLNRQFGGTNRVDDTKLAATSITISLKLRDRDGTIAMLERLLPVRARRTGPNSIVFEPSR